MSILIKRFKTIDDKLPSKFIYNADEIFENIKNILADNHYYYEVNDGNNMIRCDCDYSPDLLKMIREKVGTSNMVYDILIGTYDEGDSCVIYKQKKTLMKSVL